MNIENMSIEQIYQAYGTGKEFANEIKRRYDTTPHISKANIINEVLKIFNDEIIAIEYFKNIGIDPLVVIGQFPTISDEIANKYLVSNTIWLKYVDLDDHIETNAYRNIKSKVSKNFLFKVLFINRQIFSYIDAVNEISPKIVFELLLENDVDLDTVIFYFTHGTNLASCRASLKRPICEKYLKRDYSWLAQITDENDSIINNIDCLFLYQILFVEKQCLKYPNITGIVFEKNEGNILHNFLLRNNIEYDVFISIIKNTYPYDFENVDDEAIIRNLFDKYLTQNYNWLKDSKIVEKVKEIDLDFLLHTLLINKQIINYPEVSMYISLNELKEYIQNNPISNEIKTYFANNSLYFSNIPDDTAEKHLKNTEFCVANETICEKLSLEFILKYLFIYKKIIGNENKINKENQFISQAILKHANSYLLDNELDQDVVITYCRLGIIKHIPNEIVNKYLTLDYSWLINYQIASKLDKNTLYQILFANKQVVNYPNILSNMSQNELFEYTLTQKLDSEVIHTIFKNIDKKLITNYFEQNKEQILTNNYYKRIFFFAEGDISSTIIEDSLAKGQYDEIIKIISDSHMAWTLPPNKETITKEEQIKALNICLKYFSVDAIIQAGLKVYVINNYETVNINNLNEIIENLEQIINRIRMSNSSEIRHIQNEIIQTQDIFNNLDAIENIFLKRNIPYVGKLYSVFDILHPDKNNLGTDMLSPVLKNWSAYYREIIIFSDLILAALGSNNRSIRDYINNIEKGNEIFNQICTNQITYEELKPSQKIILDTFCQQLATAYQNTSKGKKEGFKFPNDTLSLIPILKEKFSLNGELIKDLPDYIISRFCHFAGFDTLEQVKNHIKTKINKAEIRNRERGEHPLEYETGDFIKGIGDIEYLQSMLQNGSLAKEFLGSAASTDGTPLDTDVCTLKKCPTIGEAINDTAATEGHGKIFFLVKNDDRFIITRDSRGKEKTITGKDKYKLEAFLTGVRGTSHYGIRTGFASSEIDYIVVEKYDPQIGLEIALNGFYIPVSDMKGNIVFTPKDYDELRHKIQGIKYYGSDEYQLSKYVRFPELESIVTSMNEYRPSEQEKMTEVESIVMDAVKKCNLGIKKGYDGNLTEGVCELLNTGSTARHTNIPNNADYDLLLRIDNSIFNDKDNLNAFLDKLKEYIPNTRCETAGRKLKFIGVPLQNGQLIDIDLSYMPKLDKLEYSTEMALEDRLDTIKQLHPESYDYVIANIIFAKKILKAAGIYKPFHSKENTTGFGGLGGAGVENWILQNNGSLLEAINDFLKSAMGKNYDEFISSYYIWDFGENHYTIEENANITSSSEEAKPKAKNPHDNFITHNMNIAGFEKMKETLIIYQKQIIMSIAKDLYNKYQSGTITLDEYIISLTGLKKDIQNPNIITMLDTCIANANPNNLNQDNNTFGTL